MGVPGFIHLLGLPSLISPNPERLPPQCSFEGNEYFVPLSPFLIIATPAYLVPAEQEEA